MAASEVNETDVIRDLQRLDRDCRQHCRDYTNTDWLPYGDLERRRYPNYLLAFSSARTFARPGGVMILGTNPGGDNERAKVHSATTPFRDSSPPWSSYLDDDWGQGCAPGQHPVQQGVQSIARIIGANVKRGNALLRTSPTGNLIPYRSKTFNRLPASLRQVGKLTGWRLISIARPRVLIFYSSRKDLWQFLMAKFGSPQEREQDLDAGKPETAHQIFREAQSTHPWICSIFALPAMNKTNQSRAEEVLNLFEERVKFHGRNRLLGDAGIGLWR